MISKHIRALKQIFLECIYSRYRKIVTEMPKKYIHTGTLHVNELTTLT